MKEDKSCYTCVFREKIQGDAHSKCNAEWASGDFNGKQKKLTIKWNQWSMGFPNNYDPHWIKDCKKNKIK